MIGETSEEWEPSSSIFVFEFEKSEEYNDWMICLNRLECSRPPLEDQQFPQIDIKYDHVPEWLPIIDFY